MKKSVWIIEDSESDQFVYREILSEKYDTQFFSELREFEKAFSQNGEKPEFCIADLRLTDGNFLDWLKLRDKALGKLPPFIVVSSIDEIEVLRESYLLGAVEYMVKPFSKAELRVKVERVLGEGSLFDIDAETLTVIQQGRRTPTLTSKEFQIMTLLRKAPNNTLTKNEIMDSIWNGIKVNSKTFDVHLFNLRKKLEPAGLEIRFQGPEGYKVFVSEHQMIG